MTAGICTPPVIADGGGPISAFEPADWREVPEGFYAIPIGDWMKFGDDVGPDGVTPALELVGYQLFVRKVPRVFKSGKKVGQDAFAAGAPVVAEGAVPYAWRPGAEPISPWERLKGELESERFCAEHDFRKEDSAEPPCRCVRWCQSPIYGHNRDGHWQAVPNQREAWINCAAAVILHDIKGGDSFRALYGQLTGRCGRCGRLLTDPVSKVAGIGPECVKRAW